MSQQLLVADRDKMHTNTHQYTPMPLPTAPHNYTHLHTTVHCPQVSDEGGGIPRSGLPRIWTYLYTTAKSPVELQGGQEADAGPAVLAGYGCVVVV